MPKRKFTKKVKLNEYITLKYEWGDTIIYVNGKKFDHCRLFPIVIPQGEEEDYEDISSLEEAGEIMEEKKKDWDTDSFEFEISPRELFKVHWSNLQAWVESGYNTLVLHSTLSFPLLKKLYELGDPQAKKIYKEEVAERLSSGNETVIKIIFLQGVYKALSEEEMRIVIEDVENNPLLRSNLPKIFNVLGDGYYYYDKYADALVMYAKSLHYDPSDSIVWKNLASSYIKQQHNTIKTIEEELKNKKEAPSPEIISVLRDELFFRDEYLQRAEYCLERSIQQGGDELITRYMLWFLKEKARLKILGVNIQDFVDLS